MWVPRSTGRHSAQQLCRPPSACTAPEGASLLMEPSRLNRGTGCRGATPDSAKGPAQLTILRLILRESSPRVSDLRKRNAEVVDQPKVPCKRNAEGRRSPASEMQRDIRKEANG